MQQISHLLIEAHRLTTAFQADTTVFPVTFEVTASLGVLNVQAKSANGQPLGQTERSFTHCLNKFSKKHQARDPDPTLRRRRPGGGGAIVQVENPVKVVGQLAQLLGGKVMRGMPGKPSMQVTAASEDEMLNLFDRLNAA